MIRRGELNIKRRLHRFTFALFFLAVLAFTSSLASAELITYDYDNAGQVKRVIYGNGTTIEYTYDNSGNRLTYQTFTTAKHTAAGSYASSTAVTWSGKTSAWLGLVVISLQP